jgi:two-component system, NarL family, response regulator NreC
MHVSLPASERRTQVMIIDDHPILRQGIAQLVDREPDLHACAEASGAQEALAVLAAQRVDLAIVDLSLEGLSGIELIKTMRLRYPQVQCLVLSMHDETLHAERALRAGARGYVMKQEATKKIVGALRQVKAGHIYLSERMNNRMLARLTDGSAGEPASVLSGLTDRELEVFRMIGQGLKSGQIARTIKRSVHTVEAHRANIKRKLNVSSAAELAKLAFQAFAQ